VHCFLDVAGPLACTDCSSWGHYHTASRTVGLTKLRPQALVWKRDERGAVAAAIMGSLTPGDKA
jgi:hypothetical protein